MKIHLQDGLPFVSARLTYRGRQLTLDNVILDTGSAGTIFAIDKVAVAGVEYEADDTVHRIRGVGGSEFVVLKRIDRISVGELDVRDHEVELGALAYGFEIDGIVGMDFLIRTGAAINLAQLEAYPEAAPDEAVAIVTRFNDALNARDVDAMLRLMTEDCVFENTHPPPDGARYQGQSAVRAFWEEFFRDSSQARIDVEEIFGLGNRCVMRWTYHWTDPAGQTGHIRGVDIYTLEDGLIAEKLSYVKG
jgi:uncharacterized protein (TIGR02246 family)